MIRPLFGSKPVFYSCILVISVAFIGVEWYRISDFYIYLQAADHLSDGGNIYRRYFGNPEVFPYMASPLLALILQVFTFFSYIIAALVWKALNLFFLVRIIQRIDQYLNIGNLTKKQVNIYHLALFLSMSFMIYANFHFVQFTIFLLYIMIEGLHDFRKKSLPILGSILITIGIFTKVIPIILIPYFIFRGHYKGVLLIFSFLLLGFFIPALFVGWQFNIDLISSWFTTLNPFSENNTLDVTTRSINGLGTLISTLFIEDIGNNFTLHYRRHILDIQPSLVKLIILLLKLACLLLVLKWLNLKTIFKKNTDTQKVFEEFSLILLIGVLIFPQQRIYGFFLLLPVIAIIIKWLWFTPQKQGNLLKVLFLISTAFLNLELFIGEFREIYWHYKIISYSALLLLALFSIYKRKKVDLAHNMSKA